MVIIGHRKSIKKPLPANYRQAGVCLFPLPPQFLAAQEFLHETMQIVRLLRQMQAYRPAPATWSL